MTLRYDALGKSLRSPEPRNAQYKGRRSTARLILLATVCFMLVAQIPAIIQAQPADDSVGKRVVQKTRQFELRLVSGAKVNRPMLLTLARLSRF